MVGVTSEELALRPRHCPVRRVGFARPAPSGEEDRLVETEVDVTGGVDTHKDNHVAAVPL